MSSSKVLTQSVSESVTRSPIEIKMILCKGVSLPASPVPAAPPLPDLPPPGQRGDPLRHPRGRLLPALGSPLHDCASSPLIHPSSRCKTPPGRQCGGQHTYSRASLGRPHRSLLSGDLSSLILRGTILENYPSSVPSPSPSQGSQWLGQCRQDN